MVETLTQFKVFALFELKDVLGGSQFLLQFVELGGVVTGGLGLAEHLFGLVVVKGTLLV